MTPALPGHGPVRDTVTMVSRAAPGASDAQVSPGRELSAVLAASGTGTWRWDAASGVVHWDTTLEALAGMPPGGFGSTFEAWIETLHPDEVESILEQVNAAIDQRSSYHFEHRAVWPDGTVRWLECRGQVTTDAQGAFTGTVGCAFDITDRRRGEEDRAAAFERERLRRDRFQFLMKLTDTAVSSADHRSFMGAAAAAAVPKLGDWCSIHFRPEPGGNVEVVVAHVDPMKVAWADELARRFPSDPEGETGVAAVMRSGTTEFINDITAPVIDEALGRSHLDPSVKRDLRIVLEELALTSVITVPLLTKRGVLGAMQFVVTAESGRVYDADDVALAEVAAGRVADVLDNMWLTDRHRRISETLQRALLPPGLPTIPGVELAVRYWPAGRMVEAGGDFYDVFAIGPQRWAILIGDVCGTGPDAAALTGIARHTVRAAARHGHNHRVVLEWLNEAIGNSGRDRFCTAVYATIEAEGDHWRLTTSSAGHPRPIVARRDGAAAPLGQHGSLIGVFPDLDVTITDIDLGPGDTIVLYTDGLTDLPPPRDQTEEQVVDLVANVVPGRAAHEIADAIRCPADEASPTNDRPDDVALVVLKIVAPPVVEATS